ncbi:MAG: ammonium transporter [Solirubrobacterales bacterium]|nr:ammonium transporter [Solirubrobacterales bacterium]
MARNLASELDITWVMIGAVLVLFMQAGFLFLEIGFSRRKSVGSGVAKILVNLGIASLAWWAIGWGISSSSGNKLFGTEGFFFHIGQTVGGLEMGPPDAALMLFGMLFCAVSLAIVWGTTLERIKLSAYVIYAIVFAAVIYPLVAHSVYGGGFLADIGGRPVMDFAGSTVVHLTGAVGGLAALLLLGPRLGKYAADGSVKMIPGHSIPMVGLGVLILWVGWFGFNAGSTYGTEDSFMAVVALNTQLAAAAGVLGALLTIWIKRRTVDVGMVANGAIAGLVAITAGAGFVDFWAAPIIGAIGGVIVVYGCIKLDEVGLDDPVGALSAHGLSGIWGTLAVGLFAAPGLVLDGAAPGVFYGLFGGEPLGASLGQLGVQAFGVAATFIAVFLLSYGTFAALKATIGIRVSEEEELAGLDISSHGTYGYPEYFADSLFGDRPGDASMLDPYVRPLTGNGVAPAPSGSPVEPAANGVAQTDAPLAGVAGPEELSVGGSR